MEESVGSLVGILESYRGRDAIIRTIYYGSQLVGGVLSEKTPLGSASSSDLGNNLLSFSGQLSECRKVLRLFDDLSMLVYCRSYGLGSKEEDTGLRLLSVLNNVAGQLFYPCEHIAWAADSKFIKAKSDRWWLLCIMLWGTSLILETLRSIRLLVLLQRKLQMCERAGDGSSEDGPSSRQQLLRQMRGEMLTILSTMSDFGNAVHYMPPGFLWAGKCPTWVQGLMGTVSSLIGLIQMNSNKGGK